MGKTFKKFLPILGFAADGAKGSIAGSIIKDHVLKKDSGSSDDTRDRLRKLEEENAQMRESMFNLQEQQYASNLQNRDKMNSPLMRW